MTTSRDLVPSKDCSRLSDRRPTDRSRCNGAVGRVPLASGSLGREPCCLALFEVDTGIREAYVRRLLAFLSLLLLSSGMRVQEDFDPFDPTDDDAQMGIEVGTRIPDFRAVDQHGKVWDFETLKGPNGAVLFFQRSADW